MNEQIIEKVRQYEFIYNQHLKDYRNQNMRQEAWEEIGKELKTSASKVKDKWAKLRNCYSNALKRRKTKSGQAKKKITPWKYELEMSFLKPYLETRQTESNLSEENLEEPEQNQAEETLQSSHSGNSESDEENDKYDEDEAETCTTPAALIQKNNTKIPQFKQKKRTPAEEMVQIMKQNTELRKTKVLAKQALTTQALTKQADLDDSDMFYLSMSKAAKTLPRVDQAIIKMEVCKLLSEAQIKHLQSQSTSSTPHTTSSHTSSSNFSSFSSVVDTHTHSTPTLTQLHSSVDASSSCSFPSTQTSNLTPSHDECSSEYLCASMWR